ncbi:MAG TPA: hypothetical protein VJM33_06430 [Microthrixaceae bacterium]|nr:hypothetical protein [Microthrixaceae bacterium]
MNENRDRVDEFKSEIESMKLRGAGADSEKRLLALGLLAAVAGLVLAIVGGIQVSGTTEPADQRAFMATGTFLGIALIIAGAALFLRYSMSRYLRFWMIRLIHESRANTDRMVAAIEGRPAGGDVAGSPGTDTVVVGTQGGSAETPAEAVPEVAAADLPDPA